MLGYNEEEFTRELITSYFHPDDYEIVSRFIKGGTNYCTGTPDLSRDFVMNLSFRIRKKNGEYIKILRQSAIFEFSSDNRMISNYTMLSDISFLDTGNKVEWLIRAKKEVREEIEKYLHEALSNFFTDREMDVLKHLEDGTSSLQIANTLFISKNTVDTHRRNMLGKANCTNTIELISFARKNGIL